MSSKKRKSRILQIKKQTYQFGDSREIIAANFLRLKGYEILARRFKSPLGEIDIIAKKLQTLVFIEVKARKHEELIEVILRPQQALRIKAAAEYFLAKNPKYENFIIFIVLKIILKMLRNY